MISASPAKCLTDGRFGRKIIVISGIAAEVVTNIGMNDR
jgi:hypothetical protein